MNDKEFPLSDLEEGSEKELSIQNQVRYIYFLFYLTVTTNKYRFLQHHFAFLLVRNAINT